jgi:hypothetical protein
MFPFFGKKKISDETFANYFVSCSLQAADDSFSEVCELINFDPSFESSPNIKPEHFDKFLLVVIAGNLKLLPPDFDFSVHQKIEQLVIKKFAAIFDLKENTFYNLIKNLQADMERLNKPSKNVSLSMAQGLCFKYELYRFHEPYFRDKKVPNPVFLKRMHEVMKQFIFDWDTFLEKYKVAS